MNNVYIMSVFLRKKVVICDILTKMIQYMALLIHPQRWQLHVQWKVTCYSYRLVMATVTLYSVSKKHPRHF